ncbi:hypothetical protein I3760_13G070500 [Carya illinoinensis]|uniref:Glutaredoxin domain-containing protein n=1 Tax=Carya illinoinensis TaxID=32201 RepID=A0A922AG28_CARIL|nr:hypothetical protein I3760_13G070500 [Carya illinoinensis]KAG6681008.1 hypothetical protein I3842_13G071500 [Carya illinoinensis]
MWRQWGKSTVRIHHKSSPSALFSFKDVQELCTDEPSQPTASAPNKKASIFHRVRVANSLLRTWSTRSPTHPPTEEPETHEPESSPNVVAVPDQSGNDPLAATQSAPLISIPGAEKRIVVYFTSLRVVRSTFEDCRSARSILRGFRVSIDERDLSMDSGFLTELQQILGGQSQSKLSLPRVFIGGRYVGGAEEIRQLHEAGELKKLVEGLPAAEPGVCDMCGGYRFILCEECSGSHKLFTEKSGFKSCTACNENGLIRCPSCYCAPL